MSNWNQMFRDAIERSGKSQYRLSKETGVSQSCFSHLRHGKEISLRNAEKMAKAIGIELFVWKEEK